MVLKPQYCCCAEPSNARGNLKKNQMKVTSFSQIPSRQTKLGGWSGICCILALLCALSYLQELEKTHKEAERERERALKAEKVSPERPTTPKLVRELVRDLPIW